jgi:hypothetical protein
LIDRGDGVPIEAMDPDFNDLLGKSGSASYTPKIIEDMTRHEFVNLSMELAPIESDGVDKEEWKLFEQYLAKYFNELEDLNDPHSLSNMSSLWKDDMVSHPKLRGAYSTRAKKMG